MIWELRQQHQITQANKRADEAKLKVERHSNDVSKFEAQVERLSLACQAMWELIRDRTELTEADLDEKIHEIDLRDGRKDGKMALQTIPCSSCGRPTNSKRQICIICGEPLAKPHQFEV